ncbi:MAG: tetratricopeptide repeat protein [Phycisphaerales bacterium]|nr:tetratricopeptide repeat protein [Phycisphaerales bacterium]
MTPRPALFALAMFIPAFPFAARADAPPRRFAEANAVFAAALAVQPADPAAAHRGFAQAIDGWTSLVADDGLNSADLHFNIANARMLSGDLGRAIASYLRAHRLSPGDRQIESALTYARSKVATKIDAPAASRFSDALLGWHSTVSPRLRFGLAAGLLGLGWGVLIVRVLPGAFRPPRSLAALGLGLAVVPAASLAVDYRSAQTSHGVVVAGSVTARQGPDEAIYQAAFKDPLTPGVEFEVIEHRQRWLLVQLADGRTAWLPAHDIELL